MEAEFHAGARTGRQTDRHTDMTNIRVALHYFEKEPKSGITEKQLVRGWRLIKAFIFGRLITVLNNHKYLGRTPQRTP